MTEDTGDEIPQGGTVVLDTSIGDAPLARLALAGQEGFFLLDTGATASAVDSATFGIANDSTVGLSGFSLPTVSEGNFLAEDMSDYKTPAGGQIGRVGTDFLSLRMVEFHYEATPPYAVIDSARADTAALEAGGFKQIGLPGYYAANMAKLYAGVPQVPVVGLRIGPLTVPAQIDTGFNDRLSPGVVQVNAALFDALRAGDVAMEELPPIKVHGVAGDMLYPHWQLRDAITIVTPDGSVAGTYPPPVLEVKTDPASGGIATFTLPFAQLGASWLRRWSVSIFDGPGEGVWIPPQPPS